MPVASDIDVLARFGRALADPIRCRILLTLRKAPAYPADLADERFGHALEHLLAAVVAVESDGTCPDTAEKECC